MLTRELPQAAPQNDCRDSADAPSIARRMRQTRPSNDVDYKEASMTEHIGIVACSSEGPSLCYRTLCLEGARYLGKHGHPEVSMHTHSFAEYVRCMDRDDWAGVGELMLSSANKLARTGADFLICPVNTIHQALPLIESRSPLPWLHIAEV